MRLRIAGCRFGLAVTLALGLSLSGAAAAQAYVYWAGVSTGAKDAILRARQDGTAIDRSFVSGLRYLSPIVVDGGHVYWLQTGATSVTIARAKLDGSGVNLNFIALASAPTALASDGTHIYWADPNSRTIGRANADGSGVDDSFITSAAEASGVAVDGAHVYWSEGVAGAIGRADLDGTGATNGFITGLPHLGAIAVHGGFIYWTAHTATGSIGRAAVDGTGANGSFITNVHDEDSIAVDDAHIYWTNAGRGAIGRANLDGSAAQNFWLVKAAGVLSVAADGLGPQPSAPPALGASVQVTLVKNAVGGGGSVRVKQPGRTFVALRGTVTVPVGTTIDATAGRVAVTVARNRSGATATANFYAGTFTVTQTGRLALVTLAGPRPSACNAHPHGRRSSTLIRPTRRLGGEALPTASRAFETVGLYATATERAAVWQVADSCDGTQVKVQRGSVIVADLPHHRTMSVSAGHSAVAHPGAGG